MHTIPMAHFIHVPPASMAINNLSIIYSAPLSASTISILLILEVTYILTITDTAKVPTTVAI